MKLSTWVGLAAAAGVVGYLFGAAKKAAAERAIRQTKCFYSWCETHPGQCKKIADRWYPNGSASESVLYRCDW